VHRLTPRAHDEAPAHAGLWLGQHRRSIYRRPINGRISHPSYYTPGCSGLPGPIPRRTLAERSIASAKSMACQIGNDPISMPADRVNLHPPDTLLRWTRRRADANQQEGSAKRIRVFVIRSSAASITGEARRGGKRKKSPHALHVPGMRT